MRFRLRSLLVLILLAGLPLGWVAGLRARSRDRSRRAAEHERIARALIDRAGGPVSCGADFTDDEIAVLFEARGPDAGRTWREARGHLDRARAYRELALDPWLSLPPEMSSR